jgi:uncharacterized protein YjiS (DUF1127 family)
MTTIETSCRMSEGRQRGVSQSRGSTSSITAVLAWLELQLEKRRSRRALLEMSDEQLKDIGLSRSDAFGEAQRRFWE